MTVWKFEEQRLIKARAGERIFKAVTRQLDRRCYIARGGHVVEASIVPAPKQTLNKEDEEIIQRGAMPAD